MSDSKFSSEGFDLTASSSTDVIYEIGGGVTSERPAASSPSPKEEPTSESERLKEIGNEHFLKGNHLDAYDYYTDAIEACPYGDGIGPNGEELTRLKEDFDESIREANAERRRLEMEGRRAGNRDKDEKKDDDNVSTSPNKQNNQEFVPPRHIYGHKLAIYYANRAATLLHMNRLEEAIDDCDMSILYNPMYAKAYIRRCTAYERNLDTEHALIDARKAYELQPNPTTKKTRDRLEKVEAQRLEKLKEETMGKLKDLGNSILGNFGLSLDNFQAVQDPNTGGYSISFNQNK
jgi:tetratricopeptide (TPR) repeat protein